jgi:hypothetical protein
VAHIWHSLVLADPRKHEALLEGCTWHAYRIQAHTMRLRTSLSLYSTAFFTTLGLAPLSACGGSTFEAGSGNQKTSEDGGPTGSGGSEAGGSGPTTGGAHPGGTGGDRGGSGSGGPIGGAGGTGAGGSGSSYTGGYGGGDGGATNVPPVCRNPQPRMVGGQPTGFVDCEGGSSFRVEKRDCPSLVPRADATCTELVVVPDGGYSGNCKTDADCTASPNGYCRLPGGNALPTCSCSYGCVRDEDCGAGELCFCGNPVGYCAPATNCTTSGDCGAGFSCMTYITNPGCGGTAFACQTAADNCVNDTDCVAGSQCALVNGSHQCQRITCAIGRPFLVAGEARVAGIAVRGDWSAAVAPRVDTLTKESRAALARRWTEIGLMEHASIAAFARFALELLSLGAPPELLVATQSAMADETQHAKDAFALASAYSGAPVGPGPLAVDSALSSRSPLEIVRTAILEGCIGETVAAVEAAEALAHSTDEAVRDVLARVAVEEQRHAELAWRFVKWVLDAGPPELRAAARRELVGIVEAEIAEGMSRDGLLSEASDAALLAHGILPESTRREIRRRVLSDVIAPCARALSHSHNPSSSPFPTTSPAHLSRSPSLSLA